MPDDYLTDSNRPISKQELDELIEKINDTFTEIFERLERMETEMRKAAWIE